MTLQQWEHSPRPPCRPHSVLSQCMPVTCQTCCSALWPWEASKAFLWSHSSRCGDHRVEGMKEVEWWEAGGGGAEEWTTRLAFSLVSFVGSRLGLVRLDLLSTLVPSALRQMSVQLNGVRFGGRSSLWVPISVSNSTRCRLKAFRILNSESRRR